MRWIIGVGIVGVVLGLAVRGWLPGRVEAGLNRVLEHERYEVPEAARALHRGLVIADLHADLLLWDRDPLERATRGHTDLPRLLEGGMALQVFAAVTKSPRGQNYESNDGDSDNITPLVVAQGWPLRTWNSLLERALYQAERLERAARRAPERLRVVRTRADLDALLEARAQGRPLVGGLLAIEGSHALEGELGHVGELADAGFRMFGLHHFFDNALGGSLHGRSGAGLSEFGRQVVRELDARSLIIDVAHSSEAVIADVLATTSRPVVVSHTGVRAACDSRRNISDDSLRAIAERGGLIGIGFWPGAICDPTPQGVVRALRAAIDVVGVEHVALGSDWDGSTTVAFDASELAVLTAGMLDAGFEPAEIRALMGGNAVRLLRALLPAGA